MREAKGQSRMRFQNVVHTFKSSTGVKASLLYIASTGQPELHIRETVSEERWV